MPKVETHTFTHQNSQSDVTTDVYFGKMRDHSDYQLRNKKVFFIKLSAEAAKHHGFTHVYADTFKEVTEKWEDAMLEFMDAVRSLRKVIAITVSSIMFEELAVKFSQVVEHKNYKNNFSRRPRTNGEAYPLSRLDLAYHIGYIVTVGEKKFWSYFTDEEIAALPYSYYPDSLDKRSGSNDWSDYKFIDWSEEREEWIRNMYEGFNKVIAQCRTFYEQGEKQIAQIMDRHTNLLGNS